MYSREPDMANDAVCGQGDIFIAVRMFCSVVVCVSILSSHAALAEFSQQGVKLVGSGGVLNRAVDNAQQGISVAISADGNTAIVGGYRDNFSTGAAWIWTRSGGVWSEQSRLVGAGAGGHAAQGSAVALSADGSTAIVGGFIDNGGVGAAWIWTRSGNVWTQQGSQLVGAGSV